jgi:hypothetical protein
MPMKLRMLGEKVCGYTPGPGGKDGSAMLGLMMSMEGGKGPGASSHFDMASMFGGAR